MQINIINSHNTVDWNYSNMYDTIRPAYPYDPKAFVLIHEYATHIYSRIRNIKLRAARCISSSDFYNKFEDIIRKMNI
jgi:hypothetical protein